MSDLAEQPGSAMPLQVRTPPSLLQESCAFAEHVS